jgi:hypothetical protein
MAQAANLIVKPIQTLGSVLESSPKTAEAVDTRSSLLFQPIAWCDSPRRVFAGRLSFTIRQTAIQVKIGALGHGWWREPGFRLALVAQLEVGAQLVSVICVTDDAARRNAAKENNPQWAPRILKVHSPLLCVSQKRPWRGWARHRPRWLCMYICSRLASRRDKYIPTGPRWSSSLTGSPAHARQPRRNPSPETS